jgi:sulfatase maturation enzyme AslB (radical SAM superfamily)
MTTPTIPNRLHVLAKPTGSTCNLSCAYCFYLQKKQLYPGSRFRMSDSVLESYISQLIECSRAGHRFRAAMKQHKFEIVTTNLSKEQEDALRAAFQEEETSTA